MVLRSSLAGASAGDTTEGFCNAGGRALIGSLADLASLTSIASAFSFLTSEGASPALSAGSGRAFRSSASSIADKAALAASWIFPEFDMMNSPGDRVGRRIHKNAGRAMHRHFDDRPTTLRADRTRANY